MVPQVHGPGNHGYCGLHALHERHTGRALLAGLSEAREGANSLVRVSTLIHAGALKKTLLVAGVLFLAFVLAIVAFVFATNVYHSRRFEACARELDGAVRSTKTVDAF